MVVWVNGGLKGLTGDSSLPACLLACPGGEVEKGSGNTWA